MKAIIELDVPEFQIGQEVSIYFKDTMMIKGIVQAPCGDAISRQAVLDLLFNSYIKTELTSIGDASKEYAELCVDELNELPSVKPQEPKTGHWIEKDGFDGDVYYDCSECGESWTTIEGTPWDNEWNYCPNCGARMFEPQESEG
jgi:DNA-directed RNA polymerase subunit RPC12/RpoP